MNKYIILIIALIILAFLSVQHGTTQITSFEDAGGVPIIVNAGNVGETLDSGSIEFYYPDTTNRIDSIGLITHPDHPNILIGEDTLATDSIGTYLYRLWFWGSNADTVTWGYWTHTYSGQPWRGNIVNNDTLIILSSADSSIITGVAITIRPDGGGIVEASGESNASGIFPYGIIDGAHDVTAYKQGWGFDAITDITISGNQTDTIFGTPFAPTAGPANTTAIFTWLITSAIDTLDASWVKWMLVSNSSGSTYGDTDWITSGTGNNKILHDKNWHTVETDTALIGFNLVPNTDIFVNGVQDTSSYYKFKGDYNGNISVRTVQVPDQDTFNPFAP